MKGRVLLTGNSGERDDALMIVHCLSGELVHAVIEVDAGFARLVRLRLLMLLLLAEKGGK